MITAPKLKSRLIGLSLAGAKHMLANTMGLTLVVWSETEFMVNYYVKSGPTKVKWIWINASAITGKVVNVKAKYQSGF